MLFAGKGAISWFPVHCTSINNTNDLISGDNKGVASQYLEKWAAKQASSKAASQAADGLQVTDDFVAAFGQANVGDTSPNIQGAFCQDTGVLLPSLCCYAVLLNPSVPHGNALLTLWSCVMPLGEDHRLRNGRNELCIALRMSM